MKAGFGLISHRHPCIVVVLAFWLCMTILAFGESTKRGVNQKGPPKRPSIVIGRSSSNSAAAVVKSVVKSGLLW
jgi:hypothetical protein